MAEPAELLLIKDQYELAFHSLSRGVAAEEAGKRAEALEYYRKGRQHLTQGVEVPTAGERHLGVAWDTARQLQQRMRDTLSTVSSHLSDLETSQQTTGDQRGRLLRDLPPNLYPDLAPNSQPPQSSLHHLYPSIPPTTQDTTLTPPNTAPPRPASPSLPTRPTLPAVAPGTIAMASPGDQPPAYTPQPTDGHRSLAYGPAGGGLGSGKQTGAAAAAGQDANELLFIPSGVQVFFVAPNGQVSSLSNPGYLRIIAFGSESKDPTAGRPSAFLHVCDWLYPLTADTPVLLANSGIYMFPDSLAETPGSYVGIVLSSELPAADREVFQDLLSQLAELRVQGPEGAGSEVINLSMKVPLGPPIEPTGLTVPTEEKEKLPLPGWSEKMAQGILSGANRLSQGFVKGAEATGRAIHKGAAKIRDHITPEDTPSEVSPSVHKRLQAARQATGSALRVSQFLVNGVSTVAGHVAEKMAPHVKKHGAKLVPESLKKSKDGQASNMDGAKFVAASSVQGFSTIWSSLETGAKLIGKSVAAETVTTVTYKYGNDVGQATDTALKSVSNVGMTAYNIDNLGIKAILKTTGKATAKVMVKSPDGKSGAAEREEEQTQENQVKTEEKEAQKKEEEEKKK
ncbi:spartin isoform X1 [Lates japonicus]